MAKPAPAAPAARSSDGLLPLTLSVGGRTTAAQDPERRQRVLERDQFACRFCGFTAPKYQEIVQTGAKPEALKRDPDAAFQTACIFCAQVMALERVSKQKSGALVWLPEIGQAALGHVARAIYIARIAPGQMADAARAALEALAARREEAKKRIGSDEPLLLAQALTDYLEPTDYARRAKSLAGLRLLPLDRRLVSEGDMEFNQFPQILAYWRSKDGPFGGMLPATWAELLHKTAAATKG